MSFAERETFLLSRVGGRQVIELICEGDSESTELAQRILEVVRLGNSATSDEEELA